MKHVLKKTAVLLFAAALSTAAMAGVEEGLAAYDKDDYATAFKELKPLAEKGNAVAQSKLGSMFASGNGVKKDFSEAAKWWRKAAKQGDAAAQINIGVMYESGDGVKQDYAEAMKWYQMVAKQEAAKFQAEAQGRLGVLYVKGLGVKQDFAEAMMWLQKSANQGNSEAQCNLGLMYLNGMGTTVDLAKAGDWLNRAATAGNDQAQTVLASLLYIGDKYKKDQIQAARWAQKAADQGVADAQRLLGIMYRNGEGLQKDPTEALRWHLRAAESGNVPSMVDAADMYLEDEGIPINCEAATNWYKKVHELDASNLGNRLDEINEGACKLPKEWAAIHKLESVFNNISNTPDWNNDPQKKDKYTALENELIGKLRVLSDKGISAARCKLGELLFLHEDFQGANGGGSVQNKEGMDILIKGADLGILSCINTFIFYRKQGVGVALMSDNDFVLWLLHAAEQGSSQAMGELGLVYRDGVMVDQDYEMVYMWNYLYAERNHQQVDKEATYLTPKKLASAQQLVKDWKLKHPSLFSSSVSK